MIFYAIVGFFLSDFFADLPSVTNGISYWASNLPYLIYPLWLVPVLLFRRSLFVKPIHQEPRAVNRLMNVQDQNR